MVEYKLYNFKKRFLAEPIRLIFAYVNVPFKDIRVSHDDWKQLKEKFPWGQLPMLEISDGRVLEQSNAIAEFLGKRFNLAGNTKLDLVRCNEISQSLEDMRRDWRKVFFQKNRDRRSLATKSFLKETVPKYFERFSEMQAETGGLYLVCNHITYADLLFAHYTKLFEDNIQGDLFEKFPKLQELKDYIYGLPELEQYLDDRRRDDMRVLNPISTAA